MRVLTFPFLVMPFLFACSAGTIFPTPDSGTPEQDTGTPDEPDSEVVIPPSEAGDVVVTPPPTGFFLLATETPYAPASDQSNWGDVAGFHFTANYQTAVPGGGLTKKSFPTELTDPIGLAFRWSTAELYVANRGGNLSGQSTISSFLYDDKSQKFSAAKVVISGLTGFHQLTFSKKEDEIFVGTNNQGMRRFKDSGSAWTEVLPQLVTSPHWIRGVAVSPTGKRLYASTAGSIIRQWDLTNNQELSQYALTDTTAALHFMTICGPALGELTKGCSPAKLFVSDSLQSGQRAIYSFDIDSSDNLTNETKILSEPTFQAVLSPDREELFSGGSATNIIERFKLSGSKWVVQSTKITTKNNIGTLLIFPDNAVPIKLPN